MRLCIKIGTALISRGNRLNYRWLKGKVREIAALQKRGNEIVIVSSGAVAAGMEIARETIRPTETLKLQMMSGMGQIRLMKYYKDYFKAEGICIAQILLTHHNFASRNEEGTIREIMKAYLRAGVIPIVNENDMINKEEVEFKPVFTDNDILAALVAVRVGVDLLVILTDVDGLYQGNPKRDRRAKLVEEVEAIDRAVEQMAARETNPLGLGGMASKVQAAKMVASHGIDTIVANGRYSLDQVLAKEVPRTRFHAG
ncbi:MAG: glutamate 5-kinase [Spirochaetaceae bacterium]|nr:MAG: glutamate 5-kinase [Spirochaetaceae bacterium]